MDESLVFDDAKFLARLSQAVKGLKVSSESELLKLGIKVQNNARTKAPVDTGRLRNSIQAVPGSDSHGPFVDVGSNVEYAPYQEYGTSKMDAHPYLRPALLEEINDWDRRGITPE